MDTDRASFFLEEKENEIKKYSPLTAKRASGVDCLRNCNKGNNRQRMLRKNKSEVLSSPLLSSL